MRRAFLLLALAGCASFTHEDAIALAGAAPGGCANGLAFVTAPAVVSTLAPVDAGPAVVQPERK